MSLIGVDIGTSHLKIGLFSETGETLFARKLPNHVHDSGESYSVYDPSELWNTVVSLFDDLLKSPSEGISAIGVSSMAETGLFISRKTGEALTPLIPWFEQRTAVPQEVVLGGQSVKSRFLKSGIRLSQKCSLAKILWLRQQYPELEPDAVWLSAADFIAFRMTNEIGTDYSLAGRTGAFDINSKVWDGEYLDRLGLDLACFPIARQSGETVGTSDLRFLGSHGFNEEIPVAVSGHDHICAAFGIMSALGLTSDAYVIDSIGTAEALLGLIDLDSLDEIHFRSGLSFGCYLLKDLFYWNGGLSASGGSLNWLRQLLNDPPLSYEDLQELLQPIMGDPSGILFFPYLSGSGSPHTDADVRGAFVGLKQNHTRSDLLKAVFEGIAYETELIRRTAQAILTQPVEQVFAVGGGVKFRQWMQIRADVMGIPLLLPKIEEAALLGAAIAAGIGCGVYADMDEVRRNFTPPFMERIAPDPFRHKRYRQIFEDGYLMFQEPLRSYFRHSPGAAVSNS